jgi:hypothetical protein
VRAIIVGLGLALVAIATVLTGVATDRADAATVEPVSPTLCLTSYVDDQWSVTESARTWNREKSPKLRATCASDADQVTIRTGRLVGTQTGYAEVSVLGGVRYVVITLDNQEVQKSPSRYRDCVRRWTTTHELGHALGLGHSTRGSAMHSTQGRAHLCGRITATDVRALGSVVTR